MGAPAELETEPAGRPRARQGRLSIAAAIALLVAPLGCSRRLDEPGSGREPAPPRLDTSRAPPAAFSAQTQALAAALGRGDAAEAAAAACEGSALRVQIRDALVETDERESVDLPGREALRGWLEQTLGALGCEEGERCRWPTGLALGELTRCFGECCDLAGETPLGGLALRRACFAAREHDRRCLSYLVFAQACWGGSGGAEREEGGRCAAAAPPGGDALDPSRPERSGRSRPAAE
ncbi:MAG: hypothetical protein OEY14_06605 [Myxococcales bacterium]|nr:hypothetical protein [Myxococcales bacterium]